jgi:hypothetical protein
VTADQLPPVLAATAAAEGVSRILTTSLGDSIQSSTASL